MVMLKTKSIIDQVEIILNKNIEAVTHEELNKIEIITIKKLGYDGEIYNTSFEDINLLTNLKQLDIFDCMISDKEVKIILKLKNLKVISFINCDFIDEANFLFDNIKTENIYISNCIGLSGINISNLKDLELKRMYIDFYIENINNLKLSLIENKVNFNFFKNIDNITVDENSYNDDLLYIVKNKLEITDDRNEVIKVIKND